MISMDFEGSARAASIASLKPFEEGVAEFYDSLLVPILFEPYALELAIVAER
jgi:hypothetical protein